MKSFLKAVGIAASVSVLSACGGVDEIPLAKYVGSFFDSCSEIKENESQRQRFTFKLSGSDLAVDTDILSFPNNACEGDPSDVQTGFGAANLKFVKSESFSFSESGALPKILADERNNEVVGDLIEFSMDAQGQGLVTQQVYFYPESVSPPRQAAHLQGDCRWCGGEGLLTIR